MKPVVQPLLEQPAKKEPCCSTHWGRFLCFPPWNSLDGLTDTEAGDLLRAGQVELYFLLSIQGLLHILWCITDFIPGVCPIEGASSFNAVCHTGFWQAIDGVVLGVGIASIGFGIWTGRNGDIVKDLARTKSWITAWLWLLVIAFIANTVHLIATIIEMIDCTSTLCASGSTQNYLIGILIGLCLLILTGFFLIYRGYTHLQYMKLTNKMYDDFFTMNIPSRPSSSSSSSVIISPSSPPSVPTGVVTAGTGAASGVKMEIGYRVQPPTFTFRGTNSNGGHHGLRK
jgi:hypothetical protein